MKRFLICLFSLFLLNGCTKEKTPVTLQVYIIDGCGYCDTFQENAPKYLSRKFSNLTIEYIDLDDHQEEYDALIDRLDNFDQDEYKSTPVIVFEPYFVVVGYEIGEEKYLYEDIERALKGEELGEELSQYRWEFKDEENN